MNRPTTIFIALPLLYTVCCTAMADVRLPTVLDSHMVVQSDQPIRIWGWADAAEAVSVTLGDSTQAATADAEGRWLVELAPQKADGQPREIKITGNNEITLTDVLVGEVWIGSGQSNMEWQLRNTHGSAEAIAAANHPNIRLFHVPKVNEKKPAEDVKAEWKTCTSDNVPNFSAVLYYFGKELHENLNVPIGLINSSWGGSAIEPWTIKDGKSGGMYNGMIAPLTNVAVKGSIWYQGETNVLHKNGLAYTGRMKDLIDGWRSAFRNPELAFHFVQIAPWSGRYEPGQLPSLWEAQVATLKIPNTGMAVTTDLVDNIADIHPRNKKDVGHRLSLWALAKTYNGSDVVCSGPLYESMKVEDSRIRVSFAHADGGLKSRDQKPLNEFQVAGEDGKFVDATAEIDGQDGCRLCRRCRTTNAGPLRLAQSGDAKSYEFRRPARVAISNKGLDWRNGGRVAAAQSDR